MHNYIYNNVEYFKEDNSSKRLFQLRLDKKEQEIERERIKKKHPLQVIIHEKYSKRGKCSKGRNITGRDMFSFTSKNPTNFLLHTCPSHGWNCPRQKKKCRCVHLDPWFRFQVHRMYIQPVYVTHVQTETRDILSPPRPLFLFFNTLFLTTEIKIRFEYTV